LLAKSSLSQSPLVRLNQTRDIFRFAELSQKDHSEKQP
jgi:hypothetical protein